MRLRLDFRAAVSLRNRLRRESGEQLQNQFLHTNTGDGTLPQAIHGGTRPTGVGGPLKKFLSDLFFCYSWFSFTVDGDPL